jgi:hypothetical protein
MKGSDVQQTVCSVQVPGKPDDIFVNSTRPAQAIAACIGAALCAVFHVTPMPNFHCWFLQKSRIITDDTYVTRLLSKSTSVQQPAQVYRSSTTVKQQPKTAKTTLNCNIPALRPPLSFTLLVGTEQAQPDSITRSARAPVSPAVRLTGRPQS